MKKKIDLGCGREKPEGFYGVDIAKTDQVDKQIDLDESDWDLPSDHFTHIRAYDVFEHLDRPLNFMEEVYRIAEDGATVEIRGPHFSSMNWHDPTHKRLLGSRTFENFTGDGRFQFYSDVNFELKEYEITFEWTPIPVYRSVAKYIANNFTQIYETFMLKSLLPATNIKFVLEVQK